MAEPSHDEELIKCVCQLVGGPESAAHVRQVEKGTGDGGVERTSWARHNHTLPAGQPLGHHNAPLRVFRWHLMGKL